MRLSLAVNGTMRSIASLQGPGFLNAHINLSDRPRENERSNTVRILGSHTAEMETTSMKWPTVELRIGDVAEIRILPEGDGDNPSEARKSSEAPSNLFSDGGLAKELVSIVSDFDKRLLEFLAKSEKAESPEEFQKIKHAIGAVIYEVGDRLLYPVFRRHKELVPDEHKGELL
jgi:hypothetical protein